MALPARLSVAPKTASRANPPPTRRRVGRCALNLRTRLGKTRLATTWPRQGPQSLQTDPIGYASDMHMYAYVGGDPINPGDPSGMCTGSHIEDANGNCAGGGATTETDAPEPYGAYEGPGGYAGWVNNQINYVMSNPHWGGSVPSNYSAVGQQCDGGLCYTLWEPGGFASGGLWNLTSGGGAPAQPVTVYATTQSYQHIQVWHMWFAWPNTSRYLGGFRNVSAINKLMSETLLKGTGNLLPGGNWYFTASMGINIGTDQAGALTQQNSIVVRPTGPSTGEVITMFPGFLTPGTP